MFTFLAVCEEMFWIDAVPTPSATERRLESDSIKSSDIGGTLCRVTRIIEKLKILKILGHGERAGVGPQSNIEIESFITFDNLSYYKHYIGLEHKSQRLQSSSAFIN